MPLPEASKQNLGWKLASLLIAIAIWASVHSTIDSGPGSGDNPLAGEEARTFVLPITVMTTATDSRGFFVRPNTVSVTLRGTTRALNDLQDSDIQAFVDLVDVREARELRKRILVRVPPGLTTLRYSPTEVTVERAAQPGTP